MNSKIKKISGIVLAALLFLLSGCTAGTWKSLNEKSADDFVAILHAGGGAGGITCLNAQESFEQYYDMGFRYFEYDLQLSSDGRLIGTHWGDHLDGYYEGITYDDFCEMTLTNGDTPVNERWLMETIMAHPDVVIVVDAKMPTTEEDALVLQRLEELESIYDYDLSANIIPEVFSVEMWDILKETTSFDHYLFSHYKVYYSVDYILEQFDDDRIWGVAMDVNSDSYFLRDLYRLTDAGLNIYFFTATTKEEVQWAIAKGAAGVYIDEPWVLEP